MALYVSRRRDVPLQDSKCTMICLEEVTSEHEYLKNFHLPQKSLNHFCYHNFFVIHKHFSIKTKIWQFTAEIYAYMCHICLINRYQQSRESKIKQKR